MHHWKTAFLTLLIFGLGGLAGGLVTARVIKAKIEAAKQAPTPQEAAAPDWIPQTLGIMERHLDLSPSQVQKAREIMIRTQQDILRSRDEWRQSSRSALARADEAVRNVLRDDQRTRFEEFKKKRRAFLQQRAQNPASGRPLERLEERLEQRRGLRSETPAAPPSPAPQPEPKPAAP